MLDITEPSASSLTLGGDWSLRLLWSLSVASFPIAWSAAQRRDSRTVAERFRAVMPGGSWQARLGLV